MPVIIPAGFGILSFHTLTALDSEEMVWTCGVDLTAAAPDSDVPQAAADEWETHLADFTSTITTLVRVRLKVGPNATGPTFEAGVSMAGTDAGSLLPPNCAVLVHKHTVLGGRANQGRAYLPGVSEIAGSLDSSGSFSPVTAASIAARVEDFWTAMGSLPAIGAVTPVILHSGSSDPTPITNFTVASKIATQRRRLRP